MQGRNKMTTLPKFHIAPEDRPGPQRKRSSSNHHFSGAMLNFGRENVLPTSRELIEAKNHSISYDIDIMLYQDKITSHDIHILI